MKVYILAKKEGPNVTGIGIELDEAKAADMAEDGDHIIIPITIGRLYGNVIDEGIVGVTSFSNISLKTIVNQVKSAIQSVNSRLDGHDTQLSNIISQGQTLNQLVQSIEERVTALEEAAIQQP